MNNNFTNPAIFVQGSSAVLVAETFTANGNYDATTYMADGFSSVEVAVPPPTLTTAALTENGDYTASTYGVDGFSSVIVDVKSTVFKNLIEGIPQSLTAKDFNGATAITSYAFYHMNGITSVVIPNTVTSIGSIAFEECRQIRSIVFEEGSTCELIGDRAFRYCDPRGTLVVPDSCHTVGNNGLSFFNAISFIKIGNGIQTIKAQAFAYDGYMGALKKIVITATEVPTLENSNAFANNAGAPIYVPTPDDYKVATNWVDLQTRIFPLVTSVTDLTNIDPTIYTKACVAGENYAQYAYDGASWAEVV